MKAMKTAKDAERSDDDHKSTSDDIGGGMWTVATMEDMEAWIDTIAGPESELNTYIGKVSLAGRGTVHLGSLPPHSATLR